MRCRATILLGGRTATGIEVPPAMVEELGAGKRPPVRVTINGYPYRSTVAVMGGVFMVGVNAGNRTATGVAAGDVVDVEIELDTEAAGPRLLRLVADQQGPAHRLPDAGRRVRARVARLPHRGSGRAHLHLRPSTGLGPAADGADQQHVHQGGFALWALVPTVFIVLVAR